MVTDLDRLHGVAATNAYHSAAAATRLHHRHRLPPKIPPFPNAASLPSSSASASAASSSPPPQLLTKGEMHSLAAAASSRLLHDVAALRQLRPPPPPAEQQHFAAALIGGGQPPSSSLSSVSPALSPDHNPTGTAAAAGLLARAQQARLNAANAEKEFLRARKEAAEMAARIAQQEFAIARHQLHQIESLTAQRQHRAAVAAAAAAAVTVTATGAPNVGAAMPPAVPPAVPPSSIPPAAAAAVAAALAGHASSLPPPPPQPCAVVAARTALDGAFALPQLPKATGTEGGREGGAGAASGKGGGLDGEDRAGLGGGEGGGGGGGGQLSGTKRPLSSSSPTSVCQAQQQQQQNQNQHRETFDPSFQLPFSSGPPYRPAKNAKRQMHADARDPRLKELFMPRYPLTAYNFFFSVEREKILTTLSEKGEEVDSTSDESRERSISAILSAITDDENEAFERRWTDKMVSEQLLRYDPNKKRRRLHRKTHGKVGFVHLAKIISSRWRSLPTGKMDFYRGLAERDMARWKDAMHEYRQEKSKLALGLLMGQEEQQGQQKATAMPGSTAIAVL